MYCYVNTTLALFGYHVEPEVFSAVNILLDFPGGDGLATKVWYAEEPTMNQGNPSYKNIIQGADHLCGCKYNN
jgi:hypothetical protein